MGVNKSEQSVDSRLIDDLKGLESEFLQFKGKQPLGADVLSVQGIPVGGAASTAFLIPAGLSGTVNVIISPSDNTLTLWNFAHDIYVDVNSREYQFPEYILPDDSFASALTSAQRLCRVTPWLSWGDSSDDTNRRLYKIRIKNEDVSDHTYYVYIRAYLPKLAGTGVG